MRPHVSCEMMRKNSPVGTFLACVWSDARMRPHVHSDMTPPSCPVGAYTACEWFNVHVRPHVSFEMTFLSRSVGTFLACVRFDARVAPHVSFELMRKSCPVGTFVACVWFDARVRPHVPDEVALLSCPVGTFVACEWFAAREPAREMALLIGLRTLHHHFARHFAPRRRCPSAAQNPAQPFTQQGAEPPLVRPCRSTGRDQVPASPDLRRNLWILPGQSSARPVLCIVSLD